MTKKKDRNLYAVLVLDESGSMGHLVNAASKCVDGIVKAYADPQPGVVCHVGIVSCDEVAQERVPVRLATTLTAYGYHAGGRTPLYDGIGMAVEMLDKIKLGKKDVCVVNVITDGYENASRKYNAHSIKVLLAAHQATDRWTFAFNVPDQSSMDILVRAGVPAGNIRVWKQTVQGTHDTMTKTSDSLRSFKSMLATDAGVTKSETFYATTDLSHLSVKQVHTKLDDISDRFKVVAVDRELDVRQAVEAKTKKPYVVGQAYYQLMKPEKVQHTKQVLLMEKGKKAVWGGDQARKLIGLPSDKSARVTPGNHANYDVFVQSASVNRKLPRGTKLLIDTQQAAGVAPTWDHTQP